MFVWDTLVTLTHSFKINMSKVCRLNIGKTNNLEAKIEGFFLTP